MYHLSASVLISNTNTEIQFAMLLKLVLNSIATLLSVQTLCLIHHSSRAVLVKSLCRSVEILFVTALYCKSMTVMMRLRILAQGASEIAFGTPNLTACLTKAAYPAKQSSGHQANTLKNWLCAYACFPAGHIKLGSHKSTPQPPMLLGAECHPSWQEYRTSSLCS